MYFNNVVYCLFFWFNGVLADVIVNTLNGQVRGRQATSWKNKAFYAFQGIPFAKPPLGDLRFEAPVELDGKWPGVLDVRNKDSQCIQVLPTLTILPILLPYETEDCLTVNIYTPHIPVNQTKSSLLPVMVWFYGGGFLIGDSLFITTGPEYIIDYDVILVTVNYRLGPFGFLSTEDTVIPGNNGLRDQQLGLKWVHDNIVNFGGDPSKTTIFGFSAGAKAIGYLMLHEKSRGLFRGAILESGTPLTPGFLTQQAKEKAYQTAHFINSSIDISNTSPKELLKFFKRASTTDIRRASYNVLNANGGQNSAILYGFPYSAVKEANHPNAFVTENMYEQFKSGQYIKVPTIIGTCSEEMILFALSSFIQFSSWLRKWDVSPETLVPFDMNIKNNTTKEVVGKLIKEMYVGSDSFQNNFGAGIQYFSDSGYSRAILRQAQLQANYNDVYVYKFSFSNLNIHPVRGADNVGHGSEYRFLFKSIPLITGNDWLTSDRLLTMWTNFAKFLNPTPNKISVLNNVIWPKLTSSTGDIEYLDINQDLNILQNPRKNYNNWVKLYDKYGVPPFLTY